MNRRYKPVGWRNEPHRHALAAKGIKTKQRMYFAPKQETVQQEPRKFTFETPESPIPLEINDPEDGRIYPVSPDEVVEIIKRQQPDHLEGIQKIEFVDPKGIQKQAWAQYVRSTNTIKIFSQPFENGKIDGVDPDKLNKHIREYVVPHEIGHHRALEIENITDKDMEMAETRADAHVFGMSPKDTGIYDIWKLRNNK